MSINVSIVGASGYTGLELVKILLNHPKFNISYIANSLGETSIDKLHPSLKDVYSADVQKADPKQIAKVSKLCFLALPHKTSMSFAKQLIELGVKVVDLSADYRLELDIYEKHYCLHEDKENLPLSVYGLPEFYEDDIKKAQLVANPGCYPTASLLAILPFVEYFDNNTNIFIDAKSGVSGAGKKLSETTSFVTINDNMFAYNPFQHRHSPEITEKIKLLKNKDLNINFVPHLIPVTRGMLVNIYATLNQDIDVKKVLSEYYKDSEFIRILDKPADLKSTAGTNFCDIFVEKNNNAIFINSSIDNLLRGASSQAVVNANLMCGFEANDGINKIAYVP
ncbi:MAG: N-acetyl-gamma-glutamyl-phosphate reductase [Campylobacterota bacterium]|nr:N-acetyl-gamma-glutamyl-phosphate reductase [Campylobacterota bacterium]